MFLTAPPPLHHLYSCRVASVSLGSSWCRHLRSGTPNSFMKLTTLTTMPSTVEAKTSSSIGSATLRLLAPGHPVIRSGTGLYGFQEPVPCTINCDRTESHATLRLLAPGHPVIRIWNWIIRLPGTSPKHSSLWSNWELTEALPAVKILTFMKLQQFHSFHHQ